MKRIVLVLILTLRLLAESHSSPGTNHMKEDSIIQSPILACDNQEETSEQKAHSVREIKIEQKDKLLKISAKTKTTVTDKASGKVENLDEPVYWARKISPEFPGAFHEVSNTIRNGVRVIHYSPSQLVGTNPSENYQVTTLQHGNRKIFLVASAKRFGQTNDGTDPALMYRNLTIFDSTGNLIQTTLTSNKTTEARKSAEIHAKDNWFRLCPKQKALVLFGFEIPQAKRFATPMKLSQAAPTEGLDKELHDEIFQLLNKS